MCFAYNSDDHKPVFKISLSFKSKETKKSNSAPSEEAERVDIGVDNNSGKDRGDNCNEPMFIQHTETMIEETYQMVNVLSSSKTFCFMEASLLTLPLFLSKEGGD